MSTSRPDVRLCTTSSRNAGRPPARSSPTGHGLLAPDSEDEQAGEGVVLGGALACEARHGRAEGVEHADRHVEVAFCAAGQSRATRNFFFRMCTNNTHDAPWLEEIALQVASKQCAVQAWLAVKNLLKDAPGSHEVGHEKSGVGLMRS